MTDPKPNAFQLRKKPLSYFSSCQMHTLKKNPGLNNNIVAKIKSDKSQCSN